MPFGNCLSDQRTSTEEALGTSDANGCEENKCERNRAHRFCRQWEQTLAPLVSGIARRKVSLVSIFLLNILSENTFCFRAWVSLLWAYTERSEIARAISTAGVWAPRSGFTNSPTNPVQWPFSTLSKSQALFPLQFPISWQTRGAGALQAQESWRCARICFSCYVPARNSK